MGVSMIPPFKVGATGITQRGNYNIALKASTDIIGNGTNDLTAFNTYPTTDKIRIEGIYAEQSATPDLYVNNTSGILVNDGTKYLVYKGSAEVTVASAGYEKLAILQKTTNSTAQPTVKYGAAVAEAGGLNVTYDDDTSATQVQDGWYGNVVRNVTGGDVTLKTIRAKMDGCNGSSATGRFLYKVLASAPSNSSVENPPNSFTAIGENQTWTAPFTATKEWTGLSIVVPNNYYLVTIMEMTQVGGSYRVAKTGLDSGSSFPAGLTNTSALKWTNSEQYWHVDTSSTWLMYWADETTYNLEFDLPYTPPAFPDADANNTIIAYIGEVATPINDATTACVNGTAGANQVKITNVTTYR